MGIREQSLKEILQSADVKVLKGKHARPRQQDVALSRYGPQVQQIYKALGGKLEEFPLRLGKWDIETEDYVVELDEDLHFNRYRLETLNSEAYQELPSFALESWRRYCKDFEHACLKAGGYGGKWSNSSCVRQFGEAGPLKVLEGAGAPRWKQRAFYDFVKDLAPLVAGVEVVRISIWDKIGRDKVGMTVADLLRNPGPGSGAEILELIDSRRHQ